MAKKKVRVIAYESGNPRTRGRVMVGPYGSMGKRFRGIDDIPQNALTITVADIDPVTKQGVAPIRHVSRQEFVESYEFG